MIHEMFWGTSELPVLTGPDLRHLQNHIQTNDVQSLPLHLRFNAEGFKYVALTRWTGSLERLKDVSTLLDVSLESSPYLVMIHQDPAPAYMVYRTKYKLSGPIVMRPTIKVIQNTIL